MNVGIIGLGLIGGSFAKAYKTAGHTVYAHDIDQSILDFAILSGAADARLESDSMKSCMLILIALNPRDAIKFLDETAQNIPPEAAVIDCCGTKKNVCAAGLKRLPDMDLLLWADIRWLAPNSPGSSTAEQASLRGHP